MRGNRDLLWWAIRSVLWDESWRIGEVGDSRESRVGKRGRASGNSGGGQPGVL